MPSKTRRRNSTWRKTEAKVALLVGGTQTNTGLAPGKGLEDVTHSLLSIEVKERRKIPALITTTYAQAARNAPEGRIPLCVFKEIGNRKHYALLTLDDLVLILATLEIKDLKDLQMEEMTDGK